MEGVDVHSLNTIYHFCDLNPIQDKNALEAFIMICNFEIWEHLVYNLDILDAPTICFVIVDLYHPKLWLTLLYGPFLNVREC